MSIFLLSDERHNDSVILVGEVVSKISSMKMMNSWGPRTEPCGTPALMILTYDSWPFKTTFSDIPLRHSLRQARKGPEKLYAEGFASIPGWKGSSDDKADDSCFLPVSISWLGTETHNKCMSCRLPRSEADKGASTSSNCWGSPSRLMHVKMHNYYYM